MYETFVSRVKQRQLNRGKGKPKDRAGTLRFSRAINPASFRQRIRNRALMLYRERRGKNTFNFILLDIFLS